MNDAYTNQEKRDDLKILLTCAAKKENREFVNHFLDMMLKYNLFEYVIKNVNFHMDGRKAIDALTGTGLNDNGVQKNPFLIPCTNENDKAPKKCYSKPFGPYSEYGSFWVRTDFRFFFTSGLQRQGEKQLARVKIFITNPLHIANAEVDGMYDEIVAGLE